MISPVHSVPTRLIVMTACLAILGVVLPAQTVPDLKEVEISYESQLDMYWMFHSPDWSLTLRRGSFDLRISRDGAVSRATLPLRDEDFRNLVDAFTKAKFFEIPRIDPHAPAVDVDKVTVTYRDQDRMHEVIDRDRKIPQLKALEELIRNTVGFKRFWKVSLDTYKTLVAAGWSPAGSDESALAIAAGAGDEASVQFLLDHGAHLTEATLVEASYGGPTPGLLDVVRLLLKRSDPVPAMVLGRMLIAASANAPLAELLVARGADVNFADFDTGETPLIHAARSGVRPVVEMLLARGAGINASDRNGRTALMNAAGRCYVEVVSDLLKAGANPQAVDPKGKTAFALAQGPAAEGCARVRTLLGGR
jgi:hypothetical protein